EVVSDRPAEEDDAVFEEARVDVVGTFAAAGLLNNVWNQNTHDSKVLREFAPVEERAWVRAAAPADRRGCRAAGSPKIALRFSHWPLTHTTLKGASEDQRSRQQLLARRRLLRCTITACLDGWGAQRPAQRLVSGGYAQHGCLFKRASHNLHRRWQSVPRHPRRDRDRRLPRRIKGLRESKLVSIPELCSSLVVHFKILANFQRGRRNAGTDQDVMILQAVQCLGQHARSSALGPEIIEGGYHHSRFEIQTNL